MAKMFKIKTRNGREWKVFTKDFKEEEKLLKMIESQKEDAYEKVISVKDTMLDIYTMDEFKIRFDGLI